MTEKERQELEHLTEKYYAGETSVAEETRMKILLSEATSDRKHETDTAVAGFFSAIRRRSQSKKFHFTGNMIRMAAMIAVSIAVGIALLTALPLSWESECVAYINGVEATDSDAAITVMMTQIHEIAPATKAADEEMINMINNFTLSIQ